MSLIVFATSTIWQILNVMGHDESKFCYTDHVNQEMADKSPEFAASREAEEQMAAKMERLYDNQDNQDYKKFHSSSRRRLIDLSIPVVKVPIVFHILYDNEEENLSMAQLNSAVNGMSYIRQHVIMYSMQVKSKIVYFDFIKMCMVSEMEQKSLKFNQKNNRIDI